VVILDLLAPIFLLIALGALFHRAGLMPVELISHLNRLLYWVGLPVVVFHSLVVAEPASGHVGPLLTVLLLATAASVGLAWLWTRLLRLPKAGRGTFVQAAYRGNLSFIGLPLLLTVPGVPRAPAVLAMAPMLIVYNVVAVAALLLSRPESASGRWWPMLREVMRNPIILASLAGAGWHYLGWPLPSAVEPTLRALSQMTLPLALLCIGAALLTVPLRGNRRIASLAAMHKVALSPLLGYAIGRLLQLDGPAMLAALICLTCPTAAVSYTMAKQFGGDEAVAASAVVFSALLSAPALAVVLVFFAV
jgi:malate permease and related proteins